MKSKKVITGSEQETFELGRQAAKTCSGGEVYLVCGDLGAGKTKFTQGLAAGLGVRGRVNSPTFNILKMYQARGQVKTLCHIDAYRLNSGEDLEALGVGEFFLSRNTVTVVEWADRVKKIWPPKARIVNFHVLSVDKREITFFENP